MLVFIKISHVVSLWKLLLLTKGTDTEKEHFIIQGRQVSQLWPSYEYVIKDGYELCLCKHSSFKIIHFIIYKLVFKLFYYFHLLSLSAVSEVSKTLENGTHIHEWNENVRIPCSTHWITFMSLLFKMIVSIDFY